MGSSYGEKRDHGSTPMSEPSIENINKSVQALLKDLKSLQQDGGRSGDLKFTLKDGHCVKAHSLIIKARCRSFKGETSSSSTSFPSVTVEVFNIFLTYIYTGKLKLDSSQGILTLYPVYLLALQFGVADLSTTCEEVMISNMIDHNSAIAILQEAVTSLSSASASPSSSSCRRPASAVEATIKNGSGNGSTKINSESSNNDIISGVSVKSAIKKLTLSPAQNNSTPLTTSTSSTTPPLPPPLSLQLGDEVRAKVQRIVDTAITFLSENNPTGLKRNAAFLSLPVETIKVILDSEHLCLEEEEVWRCVLRWAQSRAGVQTHVSQWTEQERRSVSEYLTPVISHIKLLLIDSRVFAEEVEPTGVVSMTLSLERYRTAALSNLDPNGAGGSGGNAEIDPRLMPRNAQKLFHSSLIINNERAGLGKKLQEWHAALAPTNANINTNWKCVYRATKHGFGAEDFHARVDACGGPTLVVILLKNNKWVCGGYTDVPWSSRNKSPKYVSSSKSFLFAMNPTTNGVPIQFPVTKKHFAVCHDANSGPIFGAGADLFISSMCGTNSDSYTNLPHSYEIGSSNGIGNNSSSAAAGKGQEASSSGDVSRSRSTTPSSTSTTSPTGLDHLPVILGRRANKHADNSHKLLGEHLSSSAVGGPLLAPSYHFMVADYEVFIPIN